MEAHGWSVWSDSHIHAGRAFADVIEQQLNATRCVVVLWSRHSVGSKWVRQEAEHADQRKMLIPFRLDDVPMPFGFWHLQTADLLGWTGEATPQLAKCLAAIEAMIGPPAAAAAPSPSPAAAPTAVAPPPEPAREPRKRLWWIAALVAFVALLAILANLDPSPAGQEPVSSSTTPAPTTTEAPPVVATTAEPPPVEKKPRLIAPTPVVTTQTPATTAKPAPTTIPENSTRTLVKLETTEGDIVIECFTDLTPKHASQFTLNVWTRAYNGAHFQSGVPRLMIQTGNPPVTTLEWDLPPEGANIPYEPGMVAFARGASRDPGKLTSDFFISIGRLRRAGYTYFGRVRTGMDVV